MAVYHRLFALALLAAPVLLGAFGWKLMRDSFMMQFEPAVPIAWGKMVAGALLFLLGIAFMGGYILHRDRKKKLVQSRFQKRERL